MPDTVAIIGAGPLGRWLALAAARAGFSVLLEDVMPANLHHAQEWLRRELGPRQIGEGPCDLKGHGFSRADGEPGKDEALAAEGMQTIESTFPQGLKPNASFARQAARLNSNPIDEDLSMGIPVKSCPSKTDNFVGITFVSTIEDAVREADLAIDCVPDELESKLEILWLLDRMAPPRTVLATPTTRLSITDLASCTYRPEKCIAIAAEANALTGSAGAGGGGREIVLRTTAKTDTETAALVERFWRRLGFLPVFESEDGGQSLS